MSHTIQLNERGTHTLDISDETLQTISKYNLFHALKSSTGYVTEQDLDKLKLNIRALIASQEGNSKDLLDLCIDIIYHDKMKAYGLSNLITLWEEWSKKA